MALSKIKQCLDQQADLELAILIGSRADGNVHSESDWDIALRWQRELTLPENLARTETLRRELALLLEIQEDKIDLIDLTRAGLAMRANVAESGIPLKGEETLAWNHFLVRVWRELEDYEWEKDHAV